MNKPKSNVEEFSGRSRDGHPWSKEDARKAHYEPTQEEVAKAAKALVEIEFDEGKYINSNITISSDVAVISKALADASGSKPVEGSPDEPSIG